MSHDSQLEIEHEGGESLAIVRVRGELDLTNTATLATALDETTHDAVILDLTSVMFVDSAAIRTIDIAHGRLRELDRRLVVVAPLQSRAGWTFRAAGFSDDFVLESVDVAVDHLANPV